jgi:hypothetical protein
VIDEDVITRLEHAYRQVLKTYGELTRGVPCEPAMDIDLAILTSRCIDTRVHLARGNRES